MVASRKKPKESLQSNKRFPDEISRDRADMARLSLDGMSQAQIAVWIGAHRPYTLTQQQISFDLKVVREEWINSAIENYENARLIELARIEVEERKAIAAWERSILPLRKVRKKSGTKGDQPFNEVTIETEEYPDGTPALRDGNPAFLQRLESIRLRRCAILGFASHQKSNDVNAAIDTLIREEYTIGLPVDSE
jgi:hypothetical protein